ncbi:MAG: SOS response-associated peptidase [Phycisphaeraceae bacterium]|nr:MAG: SOS response-associated peptidase [Phycisphaeraceae bacterium]
MCGRMTRERDVKTMCSAMDARPPGVELPISYNVAPTQPSLIVRPIAAGGREGAIARWGLIPSWAKDPSIGSRMINARAETAAAKPAFRAAMRRRRCIVPADSFYEWQAVEGAKRKQPWRIHRADGEPLRFAGLWEVWDQGDGPLESFTVITTAANDFMRPMHDRMPTIIEPEDTDVWLDPEAIADAVQALLRPAADGALLAHPVSTRVNSPANDDPSLIETVEEA